MTFNLNVNLDPILPEVFDIAHVALGGVCLLLGLMLLIVAFIRRSPSDQQHLNQVSQNPEPASTQAPAALHEIDSHGALHLLSIFQNEGRLVDFIQEDMTQFSDSEIGGAARVVHQGLRKVFHEHFTAVPVLDHEEGDRVSIEAGFAPQEIQLLGAVTGDGPFSGTLVHQGWRVTDTSLPKMIAGRDSSLIAPAQVEVASHHSEQEGD